MDGSRPAAGFTLLETLVALFLTTVAVLAVAPMFMHAAHGHDAGGDLGTVGVLAVDRLEQLRQVRWRDVEPGGSLTVNLAGYFDDSTPGYLVRWVVTDNPSPSGTRTIVVQAAARGNQPGPRRRVEVTATRGR
jgi:hypothetical protein